MAARIWPGHVVLLPACLSISTCDSRPQLDTRFDRRARFAAHSLALEVLRLRLADSWESDLSVNKYSVLRALGV